MIEVPDLLLRGSIPHKLYGRYICLWVWPWQAMPTALADKPFCFLLPLLGSVKEHTVEDDGAVQPLDIQSGVFVQEQFGIKPALSLSDGQPCLPCLLLSGQGLVQFISIA